MANKKFKYDIFSQDGQLQYVLYCKDKFEVSEKLLAYGFEVLGSVICTRGNCVWTGKITGHYVSNPSVNVIFTFKRSRFIN